jgi:phytoene synthase
MDAATGIRRDTIRKGSKSFAAASALFGKAEREAAWGLYAWCRYGDDVIDGQVLGFTGPTDASGDATDPRDRLARLRALTLQALETDAPVPPEFEGLRQVARAHGLTSRYPMALLDGFAMDVEGRRYESLDDTLSYCFHVAGVVGVMMARVMGVSERATLERACDLGLALQLTNIARDVVEDAQAGRVYLPAQWLAEAGLDASPATVAAPAHRAKVAGVTVRLLDVAETYYASARAGIPKLPLRSAWAIASARDVYREIGRIVRRRGASAWDSRASASRPRKLALLARSGGVALASRLGGRAAPRAGLWTMPQD